MLGSKEDAIAKLSAFCAYQERCISDVRIRMLKLEIPHSWHDDVLQQLQTLGFLSENRFAESYVSGKFRLKKWGKRKIYAGLKSKGLPNEMIQLALKSINPDEYYSNLLYLASRKADEISWRKFTNTEKKQKLIHYLLQKGYEMDLIGDVFSVVFKE